jgi:hypothetical protein
MYGQDLRGFSGTDADQVSIEREGRQPLIARFGGIPLRRKKNAVLTDRIPPPVTVRRKELITRLQAGRCELCKSL